MQLIVLGMHRSGTSVLARLMNLMGVYFGPEGIEISAGDDNPKGVWERKDVHDLNDFALNSSNCAWNRVSTFDIEKLTEDVVDEFLTRARKIVLEMDAHRPWVIKDPRICLLLPLWRRILEAPIYIHIHRSPVEVAASLQTRNQIPVEVGLALWQKYVLSAQLASLDVPSVTVAHRDLVKTPMDVMYRLKMELEGKGVTGLRHPSPSEVEAFIDENLYRERDNHQNLRKFLQAPQVALFEAIAAGVNPPVHFCKPDVHMQELLSKYESSLPPVATPQERRRADAARKRHELDHSRKLDTLLPLLEEFKSKFAQDRSNLALALERATAELEVRGRVCSEQGRQLDALKAENSVLSNTLELQDQQLKSHAHEVDVLRASLTAATDAKEKADENIGIRFHEIKQLTRMLHKAEEELGRLRGDLRASKAQIMRQQRTIKLLRMQARVLQQVAETERRVVEEVRSSLIWRAATPIRRLNALFKPPSGASANLAREVDLVKKSGLFDDAWYLTKNADVLASGADPVEHYLGHGASEGRDPSREFHTRYYLKANPDVAAAGVNPLIHYILNGVMEGRRAMPKRKQ